MVDIRLNFPVISVDNLLYARCKIKVSVDSKSRVWIKNYYSTTFRISFEVLLLNDSKWLESISPEVLMLTTTTIFNSY